MITTVATMRFVMNETSSVYHCICGHKFSIPYTDSYGEWCPECGNDAHSYEQKCCKLCANLGTNKEG